MDAKKRINQLLKSLGVQVVSTRRVGLAIFNEIKRTHVSIKVVLDVGANVGQSALSYLQHFSEAEVHAFEPVKANYDQLRSIDNPRLVVNKLAVGAQAGSIRIFLSQNAGMHSSVVVEDRDSYEDVEMTKLDDYCAAKNLMQIGFLKIDTEGADLKVLEGAHDLLKRRAIDFVQVETAFYEKPRHVHLCRFLEFFGMNGYSLLGIYDQSLEWNKSAQIQYANALFARNDLHIE